jgi:hypothetical protein
VRLAGARRRQGLQSLPSGRQSPEAQNLLMVSLQFPLPSQVGVKS